MHCVLVFRFTNRLGHTGCCRSYCTWRLVWPIMACVEQWLFPKLWWCTATRNNLPFIWVMLNKMLSSFLFTFISNRVYFAFQPYSQQPCSGCKAAMTKARSAHWEGGKGCRDKVAMSRYVCCSSEVLLKPCCTFLLVLSCLSSQWKHYLQIYFLLTICFLLSL